MTIHQRCVRPRWCDAVVQAKGSRIWRTPVTERKPYEISTVPDVVPACWAPFYRARGDIEAVHSMQRLHLTGKGESVSSISQIDIVRDYRVVPVKESWGRSRSNDMHSPAADREQTSR